MTVCPKSNNGATARAPGDIEPQVVRAADDFVTIAQHLRRIQAERKTEAQGSNALEPEDIGIIDGGGGHLAIRRNGAGHG